MFYEFDQNNSGGNFITNDRLCARVVIEADSSEDAMDKAEELGCYWDGVSKGMDCGCCGDRWYPASGHMNIDAWKKEGYQVQVYDHIKGAVKVWNKKYGKYKVIKEPVWNKKYGTKSYTGNISFETIEEYLQFVTDEYDGWTNPGTRLFYKNGKVKEFRNNEYTEDNRTKDISKIK